MLSTIIVLILLYCLLSGKYKNYVTFHVGIPGLTTPIPSLVKNNFGNFDEDES